METSTRTDLYLHELLYSADTQFVEVRLMAEAATHPDRKDSSGCEEADC